MDKAVIIGTYEFIGFHLCLTLLDKGIEVIGVHLSELSNDNYVEEKQLNIGRNSNFVEKDKEFITAKRTWPEKTVFFIDYYSYYCRHKETELEDIINQLNIDPKAPCILLLPIQLSQEELSLSFTKEVESLQLYYLPTIYGPWQPFHFSFQQALLHPDKRVTVADREWTLDAIFINDVIDYLLGSMEKENRKTLLKSTFNDHWQKAASLLIKDTVIEKVDEKMKVSEDFLVVDVGSTKLTEGVEAQKRHSLLLKQMK